MIVEPSSRIACAFLISALAFAGCSNAGTGNAPVVEPPSGQTNPAAVATPAVRQDFTMSDAQGRNVKIAGNVKRILAVHPIPATLVWILAPERQVSVDMVFQTQYLSDSAAPFLSPSEKDRLSKLPVTGVYFRGLNTEQVLSLAPDIVITMKADPNAQQLENTLQIPVFAVAKDPTSSYADTIRWMGQILQKEDQAKKLADFWDAKIKEVDARTRTVPANQRQRVLVTGQGGNVTSVPGKDTVFGSSVTMAGGINLGDPLPQTSTEVIDVGMEQILTWDPEVIILRSGAALETIQNDPSWANVTAVKNKRVYVQPLFGHMDGLQAILGLIWAQGVILDSDSAAAQARYDAATKEYFPLFFGRSITSDEIRMKAR